MRTPISTYLQWILVLTALAAGFVLGRGSSHDRPRFDRHGVVVSPAGAHTGRPNAPANQSNAPDIPKPGALNAHPKITVVNKDATITWRDPRSGNRQMSATAKEIGWDESTSTGYALKLSATVFKNGKQTAHITAPKAEIYQKDQVLLATGGVTMKSLERNATVKAQWVKWFAKKNTAIGNGGVEISSKTPNGISNATGAAFVADTTLEHYTLKSSAEGLEP